MINIIYSGKFKSLLNDFQIQLPDFAIISGINGAGKSHLFSAIEQNFAKVYDENDIEILPRRFVTANNLVPNDSYAIGRDNRAGEASALYGSVQGFINARRTNPNLNLADYLQHSPHQHNAIIAILQEIETPLEDLSIEDIKENLPVSYGLYSDIFYQNFSTIFKRYHDRYEDNLYHQYLKERKGKNKRFYSEEKFTIKYGTPPWQFVNRIFEEANIDYSINDPIEGDRDLPFTFKLVNKTNGANVNFGDLSSGEKVLMSLTLSLYNSKSNIPFPRLLLLDEPDAPLHPSMAKQMLRVIQEVFVKEKGVKVIMTTHSPSTIAMAPDESLFVMQKAQPRIQKRSKEQIMKLLTDGIPSFSVYADNRRQVFVESSVDADFYTKIYNKLKKDIPSDRSLYFISSGVAKSNSGNCEQVKEIVGILAKNGNQTIFGIVDWDKSNKSGDRVFVLGENNRYSIENYIFDPLILASFLLREKIVDRTYLGLSENENFYDLLTFDQKRLQTIADILVQKIGDVGGFSDNTVMRAYYRDGLFLDIPVWYLHCRGHDLESIIKEAFVSLKGYKNLKKGIVDKVIDDHPNLISMDLIQILQVLHN